MKLEVGMCVRSKINGMIGKITDIENIEVLNEKREVLISGEKRYILDNNYNRGFCDTEKDIVIASHNILDLIEPMDLMFIDISPDDCGGIVVPRVAETEAELKKYKKYFASGWFVLKGVVTREQIENMTYKVV